jgi:hypothetical protein
MLSVVIYFASVIEFCLESDVAMFWVILLCIHSFVSSFLVLACYYFCLIYLILSSSSSDHCHCSFRLVDLTTSESFAILTFFNSCSMIVFMASILAVYFSNSC